MQPAQLRRRRSARSREVDPQGLDRRRRCRDPRRRSAAANRSGGGRRVLHGLSRASPRRAVPVGGALRPRRGARQDARRRRAKDIVALYRQITIDDPLSSWTTKRAHDAARQGARDPNDARAGARQDAWDTTSPRRSTSRAARCCSTGCATPRAKRSSRPRSPIRRSPPPTSASPRITARRAGSRRAIARAPRRCSTTPRAACHEAADKDLEIKSNYQAGRSYAYIREHKTAIDRYRAAQTIDPKHSYADDAMLREAEEWTSLGDGAQVEAVLSAMPTKYPDRRQHRRGDVAARLPRVARAALRRRDQVVEGADPRSSRTTRTGLGRGRAAVLARSRVCREEATKRKRSPSSRGRTAVREYPAAYYALLALNRLEEARAAGSTQKLVAEISRKDPAGYTIRERPGVHVQAARRVGRARVPARDGAVAPRPRRSRRKQELHAAFGLTPPGRPQAGYRRSDKEEKLWAIAYSSY